MKKYWQLSLYWKCQVAGWSIASFYWGYIAFFNGRFSLLQGGADFIGDVVVGIFLTHIYKRFALRSDWHLLTLKSLVPRIVPAVLALSLFYMTLIIGKLYGIRIGANADFNVPFKSFFNTNSLTIFITGTRLMSIWVLAYHLYHYGQREINTVKENARLSVVAKEAQLSNLSAQLNPHFFFNALNNIKFLVEENPKSARRAIDLLSDLLRHSLSGKNEVLISVKDEICLVKDYLELEKLRFEKRLEVNISVEDKWMSKLIPPLSVQGLVENAIKHGINKRKEGGFINVSIAQQDDNMKISVHSSGKLSGNQEVGVGLNNLRERLRLQFNGRSGFDITQLQNETVSATIIIPGV